MMATRTLPSCRWRPLCRPLRVAVLVHGGSLSAGMGVERAAAVAGGVDLLKTEYVRWPTVNVVSAASSAMP